MQSNHLVTEINFFSVFLRNWQGRKKIINDNIQKTPLPLCRKLGLEVSLDNEMEIHDLLSISSRFSEIEVNIPILSDRGLMLLSWIPNLTSLHIRSCQNITDNGISCLQKCKKLSSINFSWCRLITDKGLSHLSGIKNLEFLRLRFILKISDSGLKYINMLTNLRYIDIRGCREITDEGLMNLVGLQKPLVLMIRGSPKITQDGLVKFKLASPNTRIEWSSSIGHMDCKEII